MNGDAGVRMAIEKLTLRWPDLVAIYRFGTSGTSAERPDSDIDLAVLTTAPLPAPAVWETAQHLALALGKEVDLVDLARASTVMRARIVVGGERLYCASQGECDAFEAHALSDYARLNEERAGILADIRARGAVYDG